VATQPIDTVLGQSQTMDWLAGASTNALRNRPRSIHCEQKYFEIIPVMNL